MKIVIAGAGAIGFHLAKLLAQENHVITLIDTDEEVLYQADRHLDLLTLQGDASSLAILEQINLKKTDLFIAVTASEKTNLLAAMLAKKLGVKKTIARVSQPEYHDEVHKEKFQELGIDQFISPNILAAQEIERLLQRASATDLFEFEDGKISIVGFTLDTTCPLINHTIEEIYERATNVPFTGIALLREDQTIIPESSTLLRKGDHFYLSTQSKYLEPAMKFVGKQLRAIRNVMIVGGTPLALKTAKRIERKYSVTIVIEEEHICKKFVTELSNSLVIHANPSDIDSLREEGLERMDAFVALTPNSEINIITSLMAEELGVYKTIAQVENVNYTHISQNIGIDTIINNKLITANNIFRFVRKGKVEAIASLHGVEAEIIEFVVHKKNRLLKKPISELHFPKKSVIAGIVRGNEGLVLKGDIQLEKGDKVIILALPEAIHQVEEIFK